MIKLAEDIYWNPDTTEQTSEASEWMNENVLSKLGADDSNPEFIAPELDQYRRPYKWVYKADDYTVEVTREYIAPVKWAKKGDTIKVTAND